MDTLIAIGREAWHILVDSSIYMIFGLLVGGLVKVFVRPGFVAQHLGRGRFLSVFKAALLGVPLPLCSCGVMPAAASLRRQGANRGAVTSFLISTPESGVDSIAITYALMDPLMTVARPLAAVSTAFAAGALENLSERETQAPIKPDLSCPVDGCCDGVNCPPEIHAAHHGFGQKVLAGARYAFGELWAELAGLFLLGVLLAGVITALLPAELLSGYLGGGLASMLIMLAVGVPLYICATASTPIAAALILKGVSPGAALVFLLAGPATNVASLTMMTGLLGKRATAIYLAAIAVMSVLLGLALDAVYVWLAINPQAVMGQASEIMPQWLRLAGVAALLALSVKPLWLSLRSRLSGAGGRTCADDSCACHDHGHGAAKGLVGIEVHDHAAGGHGHKHN